MSTIISTINTHLLAQLTIALPSYTQIDILYDIPKNAKNKLNNRYGSKPLGGAEAEGNLGQYTIVQLFEVTLTKAYKSSQLLNDNDQAGVIIELQDDLHDVYQQFKRSSPTGVIRHIFDLTIDNPEVDEDNKLIIQNFTVSVRYQNNLK